ncbi:MAG: hypothetical protein V2I54_07635 [Bacteroidales bacterium]|jgi:hypothetical protein|nr:hypothetical protein [Bacteroidales bacterium]
MQDLETKTYQFAVKAIGLIKSLEEKKPETDTIALKQASGAVSLKFIAAMEAKENEQFANNLRECHKQAIKAAAQLKKMKTFNDPGLEEQKIQLLKAADEIIVELDKIIEKLIY